MKTLIKAIAVASLATSGVANALEGSVGVANEYKFRGLTLAGGNEITTASASTEVAGLSVGIALVDADNFFERDLMVGYTLSVAGMDVDLGYTNYSYGENDPAEEDEISIGVSVSGVDINYVDGEIDGGADYSVLTFGYSVGGMDVTVGSVDVDGGAEYNYYEISTGTEVAGLDASITLTNTFSEEGVAAQDAAIVIGLSKSLSL